MAVDKKRKELLKRLKRREKLPPRMVEKVKPLTMKRGERDRYTRSHAMVLLAVEKAIVAAATEDPDIDDAVVATALAGMIRNRMAVETGNANDDGQPKSDALEPARAVQRMLRRRYESLCPAEDSNAIDVWSDGLRAIFTSVNDTSGRADGEKTYLNKTRRFLASTGR